MRAAELFLGGQRRLEGVHVVEQALDQQMVVDGPQALRAFGVMGSHFVTCAIRVGDESR